MPKTEKKKKGSKTKKPSTDQTQGRTPWISMKTGLRAIAIVSILMAGLVAYIIIPNGGWVQGILYGLLFGASIWAVFLIMHIFFRLINK
jgi:fatty acid desaturase